MYFEKITSRKNKIVLDALSLHDKKERDEKGLFFTEGRKLLIEAESAGIIPDEIFFTDTFSERSGDILASFKKSKLYPVTDDVYKKISDERSPEGVFAIFKKPEGEVLDKKASVLLLEGIQDPGNLGTLIRCAIAFGARAVLTVDSADPFSPKAVRASMGGIFKMPIRSFQTIDDAVLFAREISDTVIATALDEDSITLDAQDTSFATLMIGSEGRGLSKRAIELSDKKVIIPIENIESLNASVAGAIVMFDSMQKRRGK